jgi:hypothetical protein
LPKRSDFFSSLLAFNEAWIETVLPYFYDGGVMGTFIDWRGYPTVFAAASKLGLTQHRPGKDERRNGQPLSIAA